MLNRWYHVPKLHTPRDGHERRVGWLELFYDLVYVAAVIQLGEGLSHHVDITGFIGFAALFVPLWYTWNGYTFYANRYLVDDIVHRALVFGQMFSIGAMAVFVPEVLEGEHSRFALAYASARMFLVAMYLRAWLQVEASRAFARRYALGFGGGVLLWILAALVPWQWFPVAAALAMAADLFVPLNRAGRELVERFPPDVGHMTERHGLFTIIVLGESFVKVLAGLAQHEASASMLYMGGLAMLITMGLWWIYFDDVAGSRLRAMRLGPFIWVYAHLPLTIGITAVGVAVKKAALFDPWLPPGAAYRALLCGAVALALAATAAIDAVTERRQAELSDRFRVRVRSLSALLVLILIPAGAAMPGGLFVGLIALVMGAQVIFDLASAPEQIEEEEHDEPRIFPTRPAETDARAPAEGPRPRAAFGSDAVRLGTPDELRRDLYFHLMEGSWTQLFLLVGIVYVFTNVVFGALFMLEADGIAGMSAGGFLEAFAFSVQTLTTIGYGAMHPATPYAHALVALEAAMGLLGVAVVTGLVFAKVARPHAGVLFSQTATIAPRHGLPTLMIRAANARGNDIVEAKARMSLLIDDISPEGHHMRKLVDLPLVRRRTPIFTLSWSIMHVIDEDSPLHGLDPEALEERMRLMIVTINGHDMTYHQTVHARFMYYADDFRFGHRFVDVLSFLDDGRPRIDYSLFHETEPLEADSGA